MKRALKLMAGVALAGAVILSGCHDTTARERPEREPDLETPWVDSVYSMLTPRERVAQLFMPHLVISDNEKGRETIKRLVATDGVGGLLLGKGDLVTYARLNNYAQSLAKVPLLIAADAEWGLSMRLSDAPRFPKNLAIGAGSDTATVAAYGREMARELRRLGITVDFAPDADVNSNPDNPVIGDRSFGENSNHVALLSSAFARGLKEGGVMAVAKHFPGHGDTSSDSHKTLPVVTRSQRDLERIDLVPFRRLIDEGIDGVMIAHVTVPSIDKSGRPASLSAAVGDSLLKKQMGFKGLVFTDALEMKGAQLPGKNNCVEALKAGADILLGSNNPSNDIDAVMKALEKGQLTWQRVNESIRKVLSYKYRLGLRVKQAVSERNVVADINSPQADAVNRRLSRMSITVLRNNDHLLPLDDPDESVGIVCLGVSDSNPFVETARELSPKAQVTSAANASTRYAKKGVVVALVVGHSQQTIAQLENLRRAVGDRLVPVFMTNPYRLKKFATALKGLPTVVVAGDDTPLLREYAAQAVFGGMPVDGRLPVNVKGIGALGDGVSLARDVLGRSSLEAAGAPPSLRSELDDIISNALQAKAFSGAQVMIIKDGRILYDKAVGSTDGSGKIPVTETTLFDLASISKIAGTTAGLMEAYDRGLWKLDDRLEKFIPELRGTEKGSLTMRELLLHETGLPSGLNVSSIVLDPASYDGPIISKKRSGNNTIPIHEGYYANDKARLRADLYSGEENDESLPVAANLWASPAAADTILRRVYAAKQDPAKRYRYSDLNFILLMEAEQRMTGTSHDDWFTKNVAEPLGNDRMTYLPLDYFPASSIAATERDNFLRRQTLQGYVHDETAAFSGGIQGNAGLFSNAMSLARWTQMLLDGGVYGDQQLLSKATVDTFLKTRSKSGRRGLGFDTALDGKFLGHTGFTGTSLWMDPQRRLTVIVLTNRVHPTRDNATFRNLNPRGRILEAVDAAF